MHAEWHHCIHCSVQFDFLWLQPCILPAATIVSGLTKWYTQDFMKSEVRNHTVQVM
jgi:hypothetical protein